MILSSCKNNTENNTNSDEDKTITAEDQEKTEKQRDGLTLLKGDFLYIADAAVWLIKYAYYDFFLFISSFRFKLIHYFINIPVAVHPIFW